MSSPKVLLAHPGTQYSHQLARQLARLGLMHRFWTGFALAADGRGFRLLERLLPRAQQKLFSNRVLRGVPPRLVRTMPMLEWHAIRRIRARESPQRVFHERNEQFQERIPEWELRHASAVIGFDTSSWILAERARRYDKPFFLDQSISHPATNAEIMRQVARSYPEWRGVIEARLPEVIACEKLEHDLATKVIAASTFAKATLVANGVPSTKVAINPYGVDLELFHPPACSRKRNPLRFLFLGAITARKGVPLLLDAWRRLRFDHAELWMVGPVSAAERALIPELKGLRLMGKFPHRALPDLVRQCDILVFPSYCEGFGLVLLEALASGLPIITTDATAGPDLITDGREGRIIGAGDLDALCAAMLELGRAGSQLDAMALAARQRAEDFSWESYGDRWRQLLTTHA